MTAVGWRYTALGRNGPPCVPLPRIMDRSSRRCGVFCGASSSLVSGHEAGPVDKTDTTHNAVKSPVSECSALEVLCNLRRFKKSTAFCANHFDLRKLGFQFSGDWCKILVMKANRRIAGLSPLFVWLELRKWEGGASEIARGSSKGASLLVTVYDLPLAISRYLYRKHSRPGS
jgi:hypothetical protein